MDSFLFADDAQKRTRTTFHVDHDDTIHVATAQDVTDIVDANTRACNDAPTRWAGDVHRVASIPTTLYYDLKRRGIADDPDRFRAWLNDPDNAVFRTRPGRV